MDIQNTNIELSKYYNITKSDDNKQETRFGHFASVPRLLDVLCTIPLSGLTMEQKWTAYKTDGTTVLSTDTGTSFNVEVGTKVKLEIRWKYNKTLYQARDGVAVLKDVYTLNPIEFQENFGIKANQWRNISEGPANNVWFPSTGYTTLINIVSNGSGKLVSSKTITYTTTIRKVKTAPTVEAISGSQALKLPSGYLSNSISRTLNFQYYTYAGTTSTVIPNAADILAGVKSNLVNNKTREVTGITTTSNKFYFYAYPKPLNNLTKIIQDGAVSIIDSFNRNEVDIVNTAGVTVTYIVYTSVNPGAFNNATIIFE